jgi:short subunit fatty acids transporter
MSFDTDDFTSDSYHDEPPHDDGRMPLALAAGVVAALVAGALWAGLVFATNTEIGFVAWGVGLLVGYAMSRVTVARTRQLGYAAAACAVIGLLAGKAFIFAGSAGMIATDLADNDEAMAATVAWQLYVARELDEATLAGIDAADAAGDTLSDALWADMTQQATASLAGLTPAERHDVALAASKALLARIGMVNGIRSQLSLFDLLWLFLAVGTAFRMMAPPKEQHEPEPDAPV